MANVTTVKGNTIEITWTGAVTNWLFATELSQFAGTGIKIKNIEFHPSGADTFRIREGSLTGPSLFRGITTANTDERVIDFGDGIWSKPFIAAADQTFDTFANVSVIITIA